MKAFFEEYGFVLVSIIVVMLLVTIVPAVGNTVKTQLTSTAENITVDFDPDNPTVNITK